MRCEEARRFLGPYLDSELDPTTSFEIARHLESCAACRERFEAERKVERAVAAEVCRPEPGDEALFRRALERGGRPRRRPWAWAAAGALLALGAFALLRRDEGGLVSSLRKDYRKYQGGGSPLDVVSAEPQSVEGFFREKMGLAVRVPARIDGMELAGGRRCSLRGVPTAFLIYRERGADVSVFVFNADHLDRFPDAGRLAAPVVDEADAVRVAALRSDWKVICAAGPVSPDRLRAACLAFRE